MTYCIVREAAVCALHPRLEIYRAFLVLFRSPERTPPRSFLLKLLGSLRGGPLASVVYHLKKLHKKLLQADNTVIIELRQTALN